MVELDTRVGSYSSEDFGIAKEFCEDESSETG
jgi:hypothetical protein